MEYNYYVKLKESHMKWGKKRKTSSRGKRDNEAYIFLPSVYAYAYGIKKGMLFELQIPDEKTGQMKGMMYKGTTAILLASGDQSNKEYAKQFQGNGDLSVVAELYKTINAKVGDFLIVKVTINHASGNIIQVKLIPEESYDCKRLALNGNQGKVVSEILDINDIGVRLLHLSIWNHNQVIYATDFFNDDIKIKNEYPVTTVLIGENGSGKSFILKTITEIFYSIFYSKSIGSLKYEGYCLQYFMKGNLIEIMISNKHLLVHVNNCIKKNAQEILEYLPTKVLALSYLLNDKYQFKSNKDSDRYLYLGIRQTSNASFTTTIEKMLIERIVKLIEKNKFLSFIKMVSEYLDIQEKVKLQYLIDNKPKAVEAAEIELEIQERIKSSRVADYRDDIISHISSSQVKKLSEMLASYDDTKGDIFIEYELEKGNVESYKNSVNTLRQLQALRYIKPPILILSKSGQNFKFEDASSGEKQILYNWATLYCFIENNSLVLVDEPEISLHPQWQMSYIHYLKLLTHEYKSSHIILATHSHYLVSDLEPLSSSVVVLKNKPEFLTKKGEVIENSTYAWSAENILYNVFGVRTTRNYYFERDLERLIEMMQGNHPQDEDYINLINKLSNYVLSEVDPLNSLLKHAKDKQC